MGEAQQDFPDMKLTKPLKTISIVSAVLFGLAFILVYLTRTTSELYIRNGTGVEIILKEVRYAGKKTTEGQGSRLQADRGTTFVDSHGAAAEDYLDITVLLPREEKRLVCAIDNTNRPCDFDIWITEEALHCGRCYRSEGIRVPPWLVR
jgi:hypothetical protein